MRLASAVARLPTPLALWPIAGEEGATRYFVVGRGRVGADEREVAPRAPRSDYDLCSKMRGWTS